MRKRYFKHESLPVVIVCGQREVLRFGKGKIYNECSLPLETFTKAEIWPEITFKRATKILGFRPIRRLAKKVASVYEILEKVIQPCHHHQDPETCRHCVTEKKVLSMGKSALAASPAGSALLAWLAEKPSRVIRSHRMKHFTMQEKSPQGWRCVCWADSIEKLTAKWEAKHGGKKP